jgi:hypothetical protein
MRENGEQKYLPPVFDAAHAIDSVSLADRRTGVFPKLRIGQVTRRKSAGQPTH